MRLQPITCASSTCASSRGDSTAFCAKNFSVQFSRAPIVQTCAAGGVMVTSCFDVSGSLLPPQALLLVELLERLDQFHQIARDNRVEPVQVQIDAVIGDAVLREVVGADPLAAIAG